jgi:hypothetical protein
VAGADGQNRSSAMPHLARRRAEIHKLAFRPGRVTALAGLTLLIACAESRVPDAEQMLAAAGFQMHPADTPAKEAQLATLPQRKIIAQRQKTQSGSDTGPAGYVYADRDGCDCIFVGNAKAYQKFQQLAFCEKMAEKRFETTELSDDAAFDWGAWGPGFWPL